MSQVPGFGQMAAALARALVRGRPADVVAATKTIEQRQNDQREQAERRQATAAKERGRKRIEKAVAARGYWFPGD
jgi:pyrroline-5-carboxylate reductase